MPTVTTIVGSGTDATTLIEPIDLDGTVVIVDLSGPTRDPYEDWLTAAVPSLLAALAQAPQATPPRRLPAVMVLWAPELSDLVCRAAANAAYEALRGIAQAATLEDSVQGLRVAVLAAGPATADAFAATLRSLLDPMASFVVGASIDLRSTS